ncbi:unnamed protein product [Parnassius mnemosyne]|uniref:Integrase catalytic domain-containing protein n=1 Tax=Parnassius mnemosyne TaxID=213953 RepID=A0AAV1KNX3_9NEOP
MSAYECLQIETSSLIEKAYVNFKKTSKDRITVFYIESKLENLEVQWNSFFETHRTIILKVLKEDLTKSEYYKKKVYDKTEECYIDYKSILKQKLCECADKNPKSTSSDDKVSSKVSSFSGVRLPKITIPIFNGNYSDWTSFKDLFVCLVDNCETLDDVQKLHYLKSHLSGEAEQIVRHIPITGKNYSVCWTQLKSRYDNKKYLSNHILKRLLNHKIIQFESSNAIKELLDTIIECLNGLQNLGIDISTWDIIIIYVMSQKLDHESRKQWEAKSSELTSELPKLSDFKDFLEHRFRSLEFLNTKPKTRQCKATVCYANDSTSNNNNLCCSFCKGNHKLCNCKLFSKETIESRRDYAQARRLCYNCLGDNHSVFNCRHSSRCQICKRKHHSLLHPVNNPTNRKENTDAVGIKFAVNSTTAIHENQKESEPESVVTCFLSNYSQVLLATALVKAESLKGVEMTMRCLLDQGSQASFITESAVQALGLQKVPTKLVVSGIGGEDSSLLKSRFVVFIRLRSLHDPTFYVEAKVHVLNKLTTLQPFKKVVVKMWPEIGKLKLADPKFGVPNKIDLLLGAELFAQILEDGVIKGPSGLPVAQNTRLGWILSGQINSTCIDSFESNKCNTILNFHLQVDENELLKKFWELEAEPTASTCKIIFTEEEQKCETIFANTTTRNDSGRYIVKLPFRDKDPKCQYGNSRHIALRRLHLLEKRLARNSDLKERYSAVIREYIDLNHMEIVPEEERDNPCAVYLPHHAIIREDKSTTKLRVVFDASCPGTNGISLNHDLMVGPVLQPELRHLVMRWRVRPICLIADIVKMYRQIEVSKSDKDFQRILWHDEEGELRHYRLLRVTFGTASAPYLAVRTLQQLAYDEGKDMISAAERVLQDFYMDDLMSGCETVEEGVQVYKDLNKMMQKGGFQLQKWGSNSRELLEKTGEVVKSQSGNIELNVGKENESFTKVLGLYWNNVTDNFEYRVQLPQITTPVTKRKVVSDISRLFDPLGWIAPVVITAKIFIQKIWMSGIEWDQELPSNLLQEWLYFRSKLSFITGFSIPRWIFTNTKELLELHGFCDASNQAYAGVVFARVVKENGEVHVSLIASKTKVSPVKQVSIPRLELCGAVLLSKLLYEVAKTLCLPLNRVRAWTDSTVVLAWLSSHPSRWKPFVGNRVSEIVTHFGRNQWSHVKSQDNPADCASRSVSPEVLETLYLWKQGPDWLHQKILKQNSVCNKNVQEWDTNLEQRSKLCCVEVLHLEEDYIINRFSSLRKLIRVVAWCRRFYLYRNTIKPRWLTSKELQEALNICIKKCQKQYFNDRITDKKGKFSSLNPYKDDNGLWRVSGRLQLAQIEIERKHPILIPRASNLATLIVANAHEKTLHGGPQLMINFIRSRYWIINLKNLVKSYIHKCITCLRYTSRANNPIMGQLPAARVRASRPFSHSGLDYAGPVAIKIGKGRGYRSTKEYICLFICMATRAVHLELVSDLTSEAFIAAFKRFVSRRGHCSDLWSDNATTFVGADRILQVLLTEERSSVAVDIADWLANNGTYWHRIPPYSPNFGGLWEAGIKSTKSHLKRVIGNSLLTFEEFSTVLSQIEACLNSRPISRINNNMDDPFPLTPGHFLIGEPLVLVPDENYLTSNINSLKRWQITQRMVQTFRKRWSREYLTQFLQRHKWKGHTPDPKIGDVVLVKEDDLPPARWLYGIIIAKHPGLDGVTRVVSLRCKGVTIKRPVSKICVLPITE